MCAAYSLRTWRRNGVACDELIFLPGTMHWLKHGSASTLEHFQKHLSLNTKENHDENPETLEIKSTTSVHNENINSNLPDIEIENILSSNRSQHSNTNLNQTGKKTSSSQLSLQSSNVCNNENESNNTLKRRAGQSFPSMKQITSNIDEVSLASLDSINDNNDVESDAIQQLNESLEQEGAYAPSATSVFGGGLDLMIPTLFNFHLFTQAIAHQAVGGGGLSPKILPLIFLTILFFRAFIPFSRRCRFWGTLKYTFMAPFKKVTFRDDFTADILTSCVKPFQDMVFALFYYSTVIQGLISNSYKLEDIDQLLEKNWFLHNVVLPSCAVLPLWFKFMQCMRLVYDSKQRWPHLGNALKYLSATLIIVYAMERPQSQRWIGWIFFYVVATFYQIWWDTIMDWELFSFDRNYSQDLPIISLSDAPSMTSFPTYSASFYEITQYWFSSKASQIYDFFCSTVKSINLRSNRMYSNEALYWKLFWINACLRFCWMLNFIPAHHLSPTGDIVYSFSSDVYSYVGVIMSAAEIVRRCLWGILRVEIESIKITDPSYISCSQHKYASVNSSDIDPSISERNRSNDFLKSLSPSFIDNLLITELSLWSASYLLLLYITVWRS